MSYSTSKGVLAHFPFCINGLCDSHLSLCEHSLILKGVVPDWGHDEQREETRVGTRLGLAPVQEARAILVERLEYVGGKVDHGGLLCRTWACTACAEAPRAGCTAWATTRTAPGEPCPHNSPCTDG